MKELKYRSLITARNNELTEGPHEDFQALVVIGASFYFSSSRRDKTLLKNCRTCCRIVIGERKYGWHLPATEEFAVMNPHSFTPPLVRIGGKSGRGPRG